MSDIEAVILCAGLGTRLRPLTNRTAKPAVPLFGRPLVGYTLELLKRAGFKRVFINTHWCAQEMEDTARAEAKALGLQLGVSREKQILGTGGVYRRMREIGLVPSDRSLLVLNGDVLFDIDIPRVLGFHQRIGAAATMVLRPLPDGATYSAVEADDSGRIHKIGTFGKEGRGPGRLFTGVQVLSPKALDLLPDGPCGIIETVYAKLLAADKRVQGVVEEGTWLDLGDPAGYLDAHLQLMRSLWPLQGRGIARPPIVSPNAQISPLAGLFNTAVGDGATVGPMTTLTDCVVLPGAVVEEGVTAERTIFTPDGRLTP